MKKYGAPENYEVKLERVMNRLGVDSFDYDWSRKECYVSFFYKGEHYRFSHSLENAHNHGVNIQYGSDLLAQLVLSLEDLARMVERGIYDLSTWVSGMKYLAPPENIPNCFSILGFDKIPEKCELEKAYKSLLKIYHPDNGGDNDMFIKIQENYKDCLAELEKRVEQ